MPAARLPAGCMAQIGWVVFPQRMHWCLEKLQETMLPDGHWNRNEKENTQKLMENQREGT